MGAPGSGPHRSSKLRQEAAQRFAVADIALPAGADDDHAHRLTHVTPTGRPVVVDVQLTFIRPGNHRGRRWYFKCPQCGRKASYLYGGRAALTKPIGIACSRCMGIVWPSQRKGRPARLRAQLARLEHRLGGKPSDLAPPARGKLTFARLAERHRYYTACLAEPWAHHPRPNFRRPTRDARPEVEPQADHGRVCSLGSAGWLV